ncbi:MAG: tetratricopeptide repeat protein [Chitinophagaceae bacterium]|nr:tetratricopeptide repeat protein [Chitinophagaceae bacterium]
MTTNTEEIVTASESTELLDRARGFWEKNNKNITYISIALIILIGGYLGYKYLIQVPTEKKAQDEIFKAEMNFRSDSLQLALNGNNSTPGFLKVIKNYGGTPSGNLAKLYAGECYLQLGEFKKSIEQLESFNAGGAKQVEAKVQGMLGDANAELKNNAKAISHYQKAGSIFESDINMSSEYLFRAGMLLEIEGKNAEAIKLYQQIKEKFPRTERGYSIDKYLARLGATKS